MVGNVLATQLRLCATVILVTVAGCSARDQSSDDSLSEALRCNGQLRITSALSVNGSSFAVGQTIRASVTYRNPCKSSLSVRELVIASRPPGGTHAGGPYADLTPLLSAITVSPGQSVTLSASRTFL